jgi:hypothetical protein
MKTRLLSISTLLFFSLSIFSCDFIKSIFNPGDPEPAGSDTLQYGTGWDLRESFSKDIPVAITYGSFQTGNLPSKVDLTSKFPPIGHQRLTSTCVAWAVAYYGKSYFDGINKNLSASQLALPNNQYSPTDLFFAIDPQLRGKLAKEQFPCFGTQFEHAFNVMINRGVNTLSAVPFDEICRLNSPGNSSTASANRIKNFRRIQGSVKEIKEQLADGIPVILGAKVNNEFSQLNGSTILKNLNYTGGKDEGGHALVIAGYDDSKNAFRIINSYGNFWGDNGYLWVDYNFLVNKFCVLNGEKALFVMVNDNSNIINPVNPTPPSNTGNGDLAAVVISDFTRYPALNPNITARRAFFDVINIGNQTIMSSSNWTIYYLWVNAFNANNYGIIFKGELTNSLPSNTYQNITANHARLNYNLTPGSSLGSLIGLPYTSWDYFMPSLTGSYYLVMYIDKGNSGETNLTNNIFYVTQVPKYFNNGFSSQNLNNKIQVENKFQFEDMLSFKFNLSKAELSTEEYLAPYRKLSNKEFKNAYTSEEIISFLENKIKNGGL